MQCQRRPRAGDPDRRRRGTALGCPQSLDTTRTRPRTSQQCTLCRCPTPGADRRDPPAATWRTCTGPPVAGTDRRPYRGSSGPRGSSSCRLDSWYATDSYTRRSCRPSTCNRRDPLCCCKHSISLAPDTPARPVRAGHLSGVAWSQHWQRRRDRNRQSHRHLLRHNVQGRLPRTDHQDHICGHPQWSGSLATSVNEIPLRSDQHNGVACPGIAGRRHQCNRACIHRRTPFQGLQKNLPSGCPSEHA
mmetsp:Transcript_10696/g.29733  ORF Transcript_10696/g.29733 Transcript_10696/m.29733 type:complete len:246 (+) Transcript_10696:484-1221(+)